jgi:C4-dicarboxylate transporter, DctM subunit
MSSDLVAILGFVAFFVLMAARVPIGVAMGIVGVGGFATLNGAGPALKLLAHVPIRTVTDHNLSVIPLFVLMGAFCTASGLSRELFGAAHAWLGHRRGGLALATIAACGGFASICGSSVATAATMTRVALPEMRRFGYDDGLATGSIAAGGTLGILIPPSVVLAIYGILTDQDIGQLFMAGVVPGLIAVALYMLTVEVVVRLRPGLAPQVPAVPRAERWRTLGRLWAVIALFLFVIGGIYGGVFTATEAAGMGAGGAFAIGVARRRLGRAQIREALVASIQTSASIFTIVVGAMLFGYFLAVTQTPQTFAELLGGLPFGPHGKLALILLFYLVLGCIMDEMAMIILTVPIVFPVIAGLGFDPIWFGVIVVMTVELGMIGPPVGMNVFVINGIVPEVGLGRIYRGVMPFFLVDILRLVLLVLFPALVTFLPARMQ